MQPSAYVLPVLSLASLSHTRAIQSSALDSLSARDADGCPGTGRRGGVLMTASNINRIQSKWRPPESGTQCIQVDDLKKEVLGIQQVQSAEIILIGPDSGGHCMVYASDDCGEMTGMDLIFPPEGHPLFSQYVLNLLEEYHDVKSRRADTYMYRYRLSRCSGYQLA